MHVNTLILKPKVSMLNLIGLTEHGTKRTKHVNVQILTDCTVKSPQAICYCNVGLLLVVQQQAVQYYTGNTCSIACMHYLLTYIAYTCLQKHPTDICIM